MVYADNTSTTVEEDMKDMNDMNNMKDMKNTASGSKSDMQKDLMSAMDKMNQNMSGSMHYLNPDKAFAAGMSAHHQGAIDMAKIELKYGKDPEMRQLAQKIIDAQGPQIDEMKQWLDKHKSDK
ncbi:DUF305 domain-containing protein [Orbaceae bacterium ESL0727]|nr:DUF305 domain-containing protein [Orbaceae bacterium ESL0727]